MFGKRLRFFIWPVVALVCWGDPAAAQANLRIDHIMVGTSDLERAIAEITRITGVKPTFGGVHPGKGTQNALISIGPHTYLELFAPNPDEPSASEDVAALRSLTKLTPLGWAVSSDDMAWLRKRAALGGLPLSAPEAGSRRLPNGDVLHWSTFGYVTFDDPLAPFFIHWDDIRLHPSRTSPGGCKLQALTLRDPEAAKLRKAVRPLRVAAQVMNAQKRQMVITLRCPKGTVKIG